MTYNITCIYIYTYLETAEPNVNINVAFFFFPLHSFAEQPEPFALTVSHKVRLPVTLDPEQPCSVLTVLNVFRRDRFPPPFQHARPRRRKFASCPRKRTCSLSRTKWMNFWAKVRTFVLIKPKKTKEVCEQKLFHRRREWKYELMLNEIDQHARRVLIFVHEWGSTTNKKANIYFLYCYEVFGLQASAVQTPFDADFQSHNSSDCESFLFSCCFGKFSHLFPPQSSSLQAVSIGTAVYAWVCWIITAIVSSVLIRFDWSWLRIVARSSFFLRLSWISTSCHRVQPALPAGGKIRYDRRWTCHVDGGGEKTQTLQEKRFSFQNHDVFLSSVFLEIKTFNCAAAISFWLPFASLRLSSLFVVLAQR